MTRNPPVLELAVAPLEAYGYLELKLAKAVLRVLAEHFNCEKLTLLMEPEG